MSNYRSDNSDSDAAASLPSVNVRFLAPDVEQLRTELIRLLKAKQLDSGRLVKLVQPYKDDVVQKALPYVMKRLIDKKDKDQSRAAVLREAIQDLETKHDFRFNWNPLYQCFLKGRPIPQRTTEADLTSIKAFFGDNYREELDLGAFRGQDESKCSKLRELKPLTALVEQLNLDKDEIIKYILAVRDARLQQKRRGRLSTVTGGDLQLVKEELQSLVWTTLKRPRSSVSASFTKRTPLSRKFIDDEASEAEDVGQQNSDQEVVVGTTQTEEDRELSPTLRSPSSNLARPTISIRSRQVANIVDSTDPPPKDRLSPEEKNRTAHKVPKGAFDLWRLRSLTFGPPVGTVPFAGWNDSAYVHGHTGSGQFIYDDESGSISATRLVGFHDPMKRQYGNDYLNSWIVLPNATFNLQGITWIALTQMLSNRQIESMDGNLSRRATGEIGLAQDLKQGLIPFVENALGYKPYPTMKRRLDRWVDPGLKVAFRVQRPDGTKGALGPQKRILDYIFESEIPTKQHKQFYGELFLQDPPEIPHCVESSLSFGSFATEGCGEGLRTPNMDLPTMKAAKEAIINIMPVHYGETAYGSQTQSLKQIFSSMGCNGVPRVDRWKQALIWRNQDPRTLSTTGRFTKSQVEQVQILELQSRWQFGARRCMGLAGSYRPVQTPIVGSCLWSVLLSGERLLILYGVKGQNQKAMTIIQKAGDMIVIPPGHEYAWYNIRTCTSDEGNFYLPSLFDSHRTATRLVPGTLEILCEWSQKGNWTRSSDELTAYFMLVKTILDMTSSNERNLSKSLMGRMIALLCTPVFSYLPRVRRRLDRHSIESCTRILSSTAPFAILALHRLAQRCETGNIPDPETDSISLKDADDDIVTDYEDAQLSAVDDLPPIPAPDPPEPAASCIDDGQKPISTPERRTKENVTQISPGTQAALETLAACNIEPEDLELS